MASWRQRLAMAREDRRDAREYEAALRRSQRHAHSDHPDYRPCCCCGLCACPACSGEWDLSRPWCVKCIYNHHHVVRSIYGTNPVHADTEEN